MESHNYEVDLVWTSDRRGELTSPDLNTTIECATPPQFPKGVANLWSPEHLYAASINSCYMSTFLAIAENFKLEFSSFKCKTIATLELTEGKYKMTRAAILPEVVLVNFGEDEAKAIRVIEKSKAACLITNSIQTEIELKPTVK